MPRPPPRPKPPKPLPPPKPLGFPAIDPNRACCRCWCFGGGLNLVLFRLFSFGSALDFVLVFDPFLQPYLQPVCVGAFAFKPRLVAGLTAALLAPGIALDRGSQPRQVRTRAPGHEPAFVFVGAADITGTPTSPDAPPPADGTGVTVAPGIPPRPRTGTPVRTVVPPGKSTQVAPDNR